MDNRTKKLFEWAASNTSPSTDPPVAPSSTLDPAIIDAILGPDDATLMIDSMKAIHDTTLSLDERVTAFDNLELLVEQIDNASNLEPLKLWPRLLYMLSSPEQELRRYAAWVIGTAVQNNPKAQSHLLQYKGVKKLVDSLDDKYPVRTKALYALSSGLHHSPPGLQQFSEAGGWKKMRECIDPVEEGTECQRRIAFFLTHHLAEEDVPVEEIEEHRFLEGFVNILGDDRYSEETDLLEKTLHTVAMLVSRNIGTSNHETMSQLKPMLPSLKLRHPEAMEQDQWNTLEKSLEILS